MSRFPRLATLSQGLRRAFPRPFVRPIEEHYTTKPISLEEVQKLNQELARQFKADTTDQKQPRSWGERKATK